jgi:hypothetical protein
MHGTRRARSGVLACLAGLVVAAIAQLAAPLAGPPLYDGVVVIAPYVYIDPVGSEPGGARTATTTVPVTAGTSPAVVLGTPEQPPQAQVIAAAGALALPAGTTAIVVSITPVTQAVTPVVAPASGSVVGNVYRVAVTNQAGVPVTGVPGRQVTLALRDPGTTDLARIELLSNGAWQPLQTVSAAVPGSYETTDVSTFGDFALVGTPRSVGDPLAPTAFITLAAVAATTVAVGIGIVRSRRAAGRVTPPRGGRGVRGTAGPLAPRPRSRRGR